VRVRSNRRGDTSGGGPTQQPNAPASRPRPTPPDPRAKQFVGARLANSALALRYKFDLPWRSPTYDSAASASSGGGDASGDSGGNGSGVGGSRVASAVVQLTGVSSLELRAPWNYRLDLQASVAPGPPSAQSHTHPLHPPTPAALRTGVK
jgi:hypothetical protein